VDLPGASAATYNVALIALNITTNPQRHVPSVKMASNLARFFRERFIEATGKWNTDKHEESLEELSVLLMEPRLPLLFRLKANFLLAIGHDDWAPREEYRHDAERVYEQIRMLGDERHPEIERELVTIRARLDTVAKDQITDDPGIEVEAQADTSDPVGDSQLPGDSQELHAIAQDKPAEPQELPGDSQELHADSQELRADSQDLQQ
jgi:hypothetical protein